MKTIIKTVFAALFLAQLILFGLSVPAPPTQARMPESTEEGQVAETIPHYRQRII